MSPFFADAEVSGGCAAPCFLVSGDSRVEFRHATGVSEEGEAFAHGAPFIFALGLSADVSAVWSFETHPSTRSSPILVGSDAAT